MSALVVDGRREELELEALIGSLSGLRSGMLELEAGFSAELARTHGVYRKSAQNLLHYLSLRHHDVRPLQEKLALFSLSSLGRSEAHVFATVDAVLSVLYRLAGKEQRLPAKPGVGFSEGRRLLEEHTRLLLGPGPAERSVRIMVTMASEAAEDYQLVREMVAKGMDCVRINTAHDHPDAWAKMVEYVRRARSELGATAQSKWTSRVQSCGPGRSNTVREFWNGIPAATTLAGPRLPCEYG